MVFEKNNVVLSIKPTRTWAGYVADADDDGSIIINWWYTDTRKWELTRRFFPVPEHDLVIIGSLPEDVW